MVKKIKPKYRKVCKFCERTLPPDALACPYCKEYKGIVEEKVRHCSRCGRNDFAGDIELSLFRAKPDGKKLYICDDKEGCQALVASKAKKKFHRRWTSR